MGTTASCWAQDSGRCIRTKVAQRTYVVCRVGTRSPWSAVARETPREECLWLHSCSALGAPVEGGFWAVMARLAEILLKRGRAGAASWAQIGHSHLVRICSGFWTDLTKSASCADARGSVGSIDWHALVSRWTRRPRSVGWDPNICGVAVLVVQAAIARVSYATECGAPGSLRWRALLRRIRV